MEKQDDNNGLAAGKVVFLGVEGAGKSCLTTALVHYFSVHADRGWTLRPENKAAFAFSVRQPAKFAAGERPMQTANFHHLRWSLCYRETPCRTLDVLDYPGEVYRLAFLDPDDDPDPQGVRARQAAHMDEIRELMAFLKDARQVFVLFNIDDASALDTSNENVDAVWVTVQALKILSALETQPQISLLVTQADRLEQLGEDVSDARALLVRHVPVFGPYVRDVDVLAVSSVYAESETCGLLPLVRLLLKETEIYEKSAHRFDEFIRQINNGDVLSAEEAVALMRDAEALAWVVPSAQSLVEARHEINAYLAEQKEIDDIVATFPTGAELLSKLGAVEARTRLSGTKKRIVRIKASETTRRENSYMGMAFGFGFIFILILILILILIQSLAS